MRTFLLLLADVTANTGSHLCLKRSAGAGSLARQHAIEAKEKQLVAE